ncbi:unnamed protein product [Soboliphyme baturini]|uniref:Ras-GEF domain-containing protein n=1 Tax=Soboliphyme baturini TaxID=241478 RepID=A0A183J185_9BILA|nr:unnamed protein product [Soboliphyme baturini]
MNLGPVARLVKTRARLDESKLKVLEIQLDPSCNFYSYRSTLKAAIWRATGATNQTEKVIVPIFGLFLRDAMALVERCTKVLPDGALDYMCPFGKNESVLQHVLTCSILDETELQQASFDCEPAESQVEKELYKQLKEQSTNKAFMANGIELEMLNTPQPN